MRINITAPLAVLQMLELLQESPAGIISGKFTSTNHFESFHTYGFSTLKFWDMHPFPKGGIRKSNEFFERKMKLYHKDINRTGKKAFNPLVDFTRLTLECNGKNLAHLNVPMYIAKLPDKSGSFADRKVEIKNFEGITMELTFTKSYKSTNGKFKAAIAGTPQAETLICKRP